MRLPIPCPGPGCSLPIAAMEDTELVIRARHHSEWHEFRTDLVSLIRRLVGEGMVSDHDKEQLRRCLEL